MRVGLFLLAGRQRLSPNLNQWLDCTGTETLGERGRGKFTTQPPVSPQAPFSALRIVSTGCCEPGDHT